MKKKFIPYLLQIFLIPTLFSQSGINVLNHDIDSFPNIFSKEPSQKASKAFREILNTDTTIQGQEVKIRSYAIYKIHGTMRVTCYYFLEDGKWICKMAKYFSNYQANPNGIGYLGKNTTGTCITLLNLTQDGQNVDEFKNINGVIVTGNPPWASYLDNTKEYLYSVKLSEAEANTPLEGINRGLAFMTEVPGRETHIGSESPIHEINGFFGLFF